MTSEGLSFVDIAETILREAKEPINLYDIFDKICEIKGVEEDAKDDLISQFYADMTISAKFVYTGDNMWDIKDNQKIELWEKDGSFYKEYTEIEIPEEYLEKPEPKKAKPKPEPKPEPVVEEAAEVVEEVVAKEVEVAEEVVAVVADEPVVEPATEDTNDLATEEYDEELFDDFDEDKYNEYMDVYEDQYDD
jgi:DNA-directed RNA polymerase subunit delta